MTTVITVECFTKTIERLYQKQPILNDINQFNMTIINTRDESVITEIKNKMTEFENKKIILYDYTNGLHKSGLLKDITDKDVVVSIDNNLVWFKIENIKIVSYNNAPTAIDNDIMYKYQDQEMQVIHI